MFSIISRNRSTGKMQVEELLGYDRLSIANKAIKRFEDAHPELEVFLTLSSRSDDAGNRRFPTTDHGDTYRFAS